MITVKKKYSTNKIGNFLIALFIVIGVIGIIDRMLVPLTPFTGPDSVGYLGVAFRFMTNGTFSGIAERSYPYPAFLTLIISKSKDVENIVLFQRVFSILSVFLFYRILKLIYFEFNIDKIDRYKIYKPLSVFFSLLILFSPSQNFFDQCSHPESLTLPFVMILTYSILKFYESIVSNKIRLILIWLCIAFLINYFLGVLQPRMTLACYFIDLVLIFFLFRINRKILIKFALLAIPFCFVISINCIKVIHHYSDNDLVTCQKYATFFYYNLNTISKFINEDINNPDFKKINKKYLKRILLDYDESKKPQYIKYASGRVQTIGYNSDYLMKTYTFLLQQKGETPKTIASIYRYYLYKAVEKDPLGLIAKIMREFASYYTTGLFYNTQSKISYADLWWKESLNTIKTWPTVVISNTVYLSYVEKLKSSIDSGYSQHTELNKCFGFIYKCINFMFIPVFIIALIAVFYNFCKKKELSEYEAFFLLLILYHNAILLVISIGASTTYARYIFDMFPSTIFVFVFSIIYLIFSFETTRLHPRKIMKRIEP